MSEERKGPKDKVCNTCKHHLRTDEGSMCRRFPPTPVVITGKLMAQYPMVYPGFDTCGEHESIIYAPDTDQREHG